MIDNVADLFAETLQQAGVHRVYGIVGDSLNAITEALRKRGEIDWVHVRHEEAAAFAAGAEAHLTGRLAVCAGSAGPGNLHLINGLFDAQRSRVPVLAIAAHIPSAEIGSGYFQETHPQELFRECSVFRELVSDAEQMPGILNDAIRAAVGLRGVAVVVIPGDVAMRPAASKNVVPAAGLLPPIAVVRPRDRELDALAEMLNEGRRITLLCGRGCARAHDEVVALAQTLQAPVVHALAGKEYLEWGNPYDVGMTGLLGVSSGYYAMTECDVLLMLGTDFPYRQFFPEDARIAQVDIRPEQLGRRCRLDLGLVGDVRATIEALAPRLELKTDRRHLEKSLDHYRKTRENLDELAALDREGDQLHPQQVTGVLSDAATEDAVFTVDVGTPTIWVARHLRMNGRRRLVGSWVHGSMAGALPQAIGAQSAFPDRQVVALSGDGGLAMLMGELLTLRQHRLPVKIVIFNNGSLGFVELEMKVAGLLPTGVALDNPDFAAVARACGIHGVRVERPADLKAAVDDVLAHDGPAVLDAVVTRQELSLPPKITLEQVKGFGLWALKAVMNGKGDELIELAKTNLAR